MTSLDRPAQKNQRLVQLLSELPGLALAAENQLEACAAFVEGLRRHLHARGVGIWCSLEGEWAELAAAGTRVLESSQDRLAQALDGEEIVQSGGWTWMGFGGRTVRQVLVVLVDEDWHPSGWELLRGALNSIVGSVHLREVGTRLLKLRQRIARASVTHATSPARLAGEIELALMDLYGAQQARLFLAKPGQQPLVLVSSPLPAISAEHATRLRAVVRSRQPDFITGSESNDWNTKGLLLPLALSPAPPLGVLELTFARPKATDPTVDEAELAALSELLAEECARMDSANRSVRPLDTPHGERHASPVHGEDGMIGNCQAIQDLRERVARVAPTDLCVLVLGENGTGKEVVAQRIHALSRRQHEIMLAVNCAAMSETLLESELFGHEKGAFTDAHETRPGKFELASRGTLFLDEVGDLSPRAQAKFLRVLEDKTIIRVGGDQPIRTDTRIIAATNRDLAQMVRDHEFREDLFFRLNVVPIVLPPLRERGEDILTLATEFLRTHAERLGRRPLYLSESAQRSIQTYRWPGNVRELQNLMERLTFLHPRPEIEAHDLHLPEGNGGNDPFAIDPTLPLADATRQFQMEFIQRHIAASGNNVTEAARRMGMHRTNLYRKMTQLGMPNTHGDELDFESP